MISVIVPIYNSIRYLNECVESILNQSFRDFELLLIDDGSSDGSGELCDALSKSDSRIRVFHQPNGGVTSARRMGVEKSQGEWVVFVDSDDTIPVDSLSNLYDGLAFHDDTDMVVGRSRDMPMEKYSMLSLEQWRKYCIAREEFMPGPWCRLIRKSLFNERTLEIPREIVKGEDMLMNIRLAFDMHRDLVVVNRKVYNYRSNPDSCVHTFIQNADYEKKLHDLRLESIPLAFHRKFLKDTVHVRLLELNEMYMHQPLDGSWMKSEFYRILCHDIKTSDYRLSFIERVKFGYGINVDRKWAWRIVQTDYKIYLIKCRIKVFIKRILRIK